MLMDVGNSRLGSAENFLATPPSFSVCVCVCVWKYTDISLEVPVYQTKTLYYAKFYRIYLDIYRVWYEATRTVVASVNEPSKY